MLKENKNKEEIKEEIKEETKEEAKEEPKEETKEVKEEPKEEPKEELKNDVYANDDIVEMLKAVEKRLNAFDDKLETVLSMTVDSGAIINEGVNINSDDSAKNYAEDFIDIDDLDLSL